MPEDADEHLFSLEKLVKERLEGKAELQLRKRPNDFFQTNRTFNLQRMASLHNNNMICKRVYLKILVVFNVVVKIISKFTV